MWNSYFQKMKEKEEFDEEAKTRGMSPIELKIEKKKERLEALRKLNFLGASSVNEYIELEREILALKREDEYSKWFEENKQALSKLFDVLFDAFAIKKQPNVCLEYNVDDYVSFDGQVLREDFLSELLKKYGYFCYTKFWNDKKSKFEIRLKRKED